MLLAEVQAKVDRKDQLKTISIPSDASVLVVDDSITRRHWFLSSVKMPRAYIVHEPTQAIEILNQGGIEFVFLDFDLGLGVDSTPVAEHLRYTKFTGSVFVITENSFGWDVLTTIFPKAVVMPFGTFQIALSERPKFSDDE